MTVTVSQLANLEATVAKHIAELQELLAELQAARHQLDESNREPNAEWMRQFGHYLSEDFERKVTAHFHDAKRQALAAQTSRPAASAKQ